MKTGATLEIAIATCRLSNHSVGYFFKDRLEWLFLW